MSSLSLMGTKTDMLSSVGLVLHNFSSLALDSANSYSKLFILRGNFFPTNFILFIRFIHLTMNSSFQALPFLTLPRIS